MRGRFEFMLYRTKAGEPAGIDPALALLGSQGWEIRGVSAREDGSIVVALQRPLDEEPPLAASSAIAATLEEPLSVPAADKFP